MNSMMEQQSNEISQLKVTYSNGRIITCTVEPLLMDTLYKVEKPPYMKVSKGQV